MKVFEQQEEIETEEAPSWFPNPKKPELTIHDVDWEVEEVPFITSEINFGIGAAFFLMVFVGLTYWWTRK